MPSIRLVRALPTEIGLYGTQTQGEIAEARGGPGHGPEQESSDKTLSLDELRKETAKSDRDDGRGKGNRHGQERDDMER